MTCGTRTQYQRGCRCQPCNTANNIYTRKHNESRRQATADSIGAYVIPSATRGQHGAGAGLPTVDLAASWRQSAACTGDNPALWDIDEPTLWPQGAKICADCPVQQQCLTDHLGNLDAFGLYGGVPLWAGVPMTQKRETA